ncbi:Cys-tRNA(Pro) deacylase [Cohnella soli]|uniref:Cys-tRNA(Pro)/Cys-tRNA(Cys) deacylase n=1 Tax=Cohnella soli TaxID=425005 RepID=A0ABW0I0E9_9BACL
MAGKTTASRILDTMKIPYTLHEYEWDEDDLAASTVADKVGLPVDRLFKTLVLKGDKTGFVLACVPGDKELDLKALAAASRNKSVEMVPVKDLQSVTGYIRGGVSPLGTKKKFPLFIDESIRGLDPVSISAGRRGTQIFVNGDRLAEACEATVCAISK